MLISGLKGKMVRGRRRRGRKCSTMIHSDCVYKLYWSDCVYVLYWSDCVHVCSLTVEVCLALPTDQRPISRKSRKLFGPEKLFLLAVFISKIEVLIVLKVIQCSY